MKIKEQVEVIKLKLRDCGNYRELAFAAGVSFDWINRFLGGQIKSPGLTNLTKLEDFFDKHPTVGVGMYKKRRNRRSGKKINNKFV